jgi:hypothetical protein
MTTVAWDGVSMAADTLSTDGWGLKEFCEGKIWVGRDFLVGSSGEWGQAYKWWKSLPKGAYGYEVVEHGIKDWNRETNDPVLMLVHFEDNNPKDPVIYRIASGVFYKTSLQMFAIGSGRDYALASMYWGKSSAEAVKCAMAFDNATGGEIIEREFYHCE